MTPFRKALKLQEKLDKYVFAHNAGNANGGGFGSRTEAYDKYMASRWEEGKSNLVGKSMVIKKSTHFPKGKLI